MTMRIRFILLLGLIASGFVGCAHQQLTRDQHSFRKSEVDAWHKSAVEATNSPEEWSRLAGKIFAKGSFEIDMSRADYNLDCPDGQVEVIVPAILTANRKSCLLKLRFDRGTGLVMFMSEELEP